MAKIVRRVFWNKRNQQPTVTLPKKKLDPSIKFGDELFVELRVIKKKRRKK